MPQIEWFYAKNDQPCGPVSPVELKKFAEEGQLHRQDLVWREGMGEWIPAGRIKGLFDSNGEAQTEGEASAAPETAEVDSSPPGEVPAGAIPQPPAASEWPVRPVPSTFVPESPAPVPKIEKRPKVEKKFPIEKKSELEDQWELKPLRHPLDALADLARQQFGPRFVHSTVVLFRVGGQFGVLLAMVATLFLGVAAGGRLGAIATTVPVAAGAVVLLLLVHYAAGRVFSVLEELDRGARANLSATGPLDALAWAMTVAGLVALIGFSVHAMGTSTVWSGFLAVALFILCQFAAVVAWNPRAVWLDIAPAATPGREAGAQLCFLGKLLWRLCLVGYGAGMVLGALATLNVAVHIGLPDEPEPGWLGAELFVPLALIAAAFPLPVVGYLAFLVCQFLAELLLTRPGNEERRGQGGPLR